VHSAENQWYILAENSWYNLVANPWYIIGRKMTLPAFLPDVGFVARLKSVEVIGSAGQRVDPIHRAQADAVDPHGIVIHPAVNMSPYERESDDEQECKR